jgi:hypothetical protein
MPVAHRPCVGDLGLSGELALGLADRLVGAPDVFDSLATAKERDRLMRLRAGLAHVGDPALAGLDASDLVVLATMAADPGRAALDRDG